MPGVSSLTPLVFTYAYVTYQDIKQVGNLKDQTVIVVKAPTETKLEVPDPDEVRMHILVGDVERMDFIFGPVTVAGNAESLQSVQQSEGFLLLQKSLFRVVKFLAGSGTRHVQIHVSQRVKEPHLHWAHNVQVIESSNGMWQF